MKFTIHNVNSAPEAAKEILTRSAGAFGFVPNLFGVMAEAPALLKGYTSLMRLFEEASLKAAERQVVLLAASYENECEYCVLAHSAIAAMQQVPADAVCAIRDDEAIADPKLEALRRFTAVVVKSQGRPTEEDTKVFLAAGYGKQQILEVVLGVGLKTLSNYTNHIAETPLDEAFNKAGWSKASGAS